ncbi:hypothetical protein F6A46_06290 [Tenacibaculum finnmarkense genomovar ulcerans]|uniref:hypothetical protein n=1 Tax=Tenacibaculum finnmarkense TaxID=2781243 RepID=UPI00187B260A|nr:hypothetical protein [Tenacibaculum finnmarkense]MBE7687843.1 hypothetical protein [Tenacibaculum finnmarkense genomovar ulcerans]
MPTVNFLYRNKKEISNISIRLNHTKSIDIRVTTPIVSKRKYWIYKGTRNGKSITKHRKLSELVKAGATAEILNHRAELETLQNFVLKNFIKDYNNGLPINTDWLKNCIDENSGILNTKEKIKQVEVIAKEKETLNLLTNAVQCMFDKYATNENEQKKYKVTYNLLLDYQTAKNTIFNTKDLNRNFSIDFKNWCLLELRYSKSYINAVLKRFRGSVLNAYANDETDTVEISKTINSLDMFKSVYKDKIIITLSYNEIDKIDNTIIADANLQDAKKCILFGCETGLRYSDLNKLNDSNSKNINGINYWTFRTQKTDLTVQIPISKRIKYLIDKYGLPKTNYPANGVKLNKDIKQVCKIAGINEITKGSKIVSLLIDGKKQKRNQSIETAKYNLITTRTFRRSFATNYYGRIDTNLIMMVTAHKTESQLKAYIGAKGLQDIERSKKQVDDFHENRKLEKENIKLTVVGKASNM